MSETGEQGERKEKREILKKAEEMVKRPENKMDVHQAIEIFDGKEQLSLFDAKKGDIAWWTTESGSAGYYIVDIPPTRVDDARGWVLGEGEILVVRKEGHPLGDHQGKGHISGAEFMGMLAAAKIVKGQPLEYFITLEGKRRERYITTEVVDMGLIKAETLKKN
jgi:hypothetical protein